MPAWPPQTPGVPDHAAPDPETDALTLTSVPGLGVVPRPLLEAAEREAKALLNGDAAAAAGITSVLSFLGLSTATSSYLVGLLGLVLGAVVYGSTTYAQAQAAYRVWRDAERDVTPVSQPSNADGVPLVPAR